MIHSAFEKLTPYLTDFTGCHLIFKDIFDSNKKIGFPIKTVLELGIYRIPGDINSNLPGQSTKTLMIIQNEHPIEKHISLDIDDCSKTIENCEKFVNNCGLSVKNLSFVQCSSIEFDVNANFPNGVDFIFLDTNHDDNYASKLGYENQDGAGMTYKEICHYAKHLTQNGRMLLHDTFNYYVPRAYGVNTEGAIMKFLDNNKDFLFVEHKPNGCGLGELFRKDSEVAKLYESRGVSFGIEQLPQ